MQKDLIDNIVIQIDEYLKDNITKNSASSFALQIIKSQDLDKLPIEVNQALHLLFDLHDANSCWCPTKEELEKCKKSIEIL